MMIIMADVEIATVDQAKRRVSRRPKADASKGAAERMAQPSSTSKYDMLFGRYSYDVEVNDPSMRGYINLKRLAYPMTFRNNSKKMFSKREINVVERLINALMRGGTGKKVGGHVIRTEGRLQGKKLKVMHIVEDAFAIIERKSGKNPVQILVTALENSAPIEDTTRIRQGGTVSTVSVDMSASRRLDVALKNVALASIIGAFRKRKSISEALADELIMAANNDINSYAIKIKNDKDRMARSAR